MNPYAKKLKLLLKQQEAGIDKTREIQETKKLIIEGAVPDFQYFHVSDIYSHPPENLEECSRARAMLEGIGNEPGVGEAMEFVSMCQMAFKKGKK